MKMTDLLEKDKENILTGIAQGGTAAKAVTILENETDKLLLKFNDQCESDREREAAAHMMQAVRLSVPMIDSAGKTKVWERGSDDSAKKEKGKVSIPFVLLTIASVLLVAYGLVPLVVASLINAGEQYRTQLIVRCCFVIGGMIMGFFAGAMQRKKEKQAAKEHQVEIRPDADKIFRNYRAAIYSVDQSLEEISAAERWSKREKAGEIDGRKVILYAGSLKTIYGIGTLAEGFVRHTGFEQRNVHTGNQLDGSFHFDLEIGYIEGQLEHLEEALAGREIKGSGIIGINKIFFLQRRSYTDHLLVKEIAIGTTGFSFLKLLLALIERKKGRTGFGKYISNSRTCRQS